MATDTTHSTRQRLAQALEGVGGAIHERHLVPAASLREAADAAELLGPAPSLAGAGGSEFVEAVAALRRWARDAGDGSGMALRYVQRATHHLAKALRAHAETATAVPTEMAAAIERLSGSFARYAPHFSPDVRAGGL